MNDNSLPKIRFMFCIMFVCVFATIAFAMYSDHQYKMKKLDLIEKGILKSSVEMIDKDK